MKSPEYKVLINYQRNGVSVSRSLYSGPAKKHALKAYEEAVVLARHGVLVNCRIRYFDGFRLRDGFERDSAALASDTGYKLYLPS